MGWGYAIAVRKLQGEQLIRPNKDYLSTIEAYKIAFDKMFEFNVQLFNDYPNVKLQELDNAKKVVFASGQVFDNEQLFEHAIVHILRHWRQIERFLLKLRLSE
jgi:hypothetical protein